MSFLDILILKMYTSLLKKKKHKKLLAQLLKAEQHHPIPIFNMPAGIYSSPAALCLSKHSGKAQLQNLGATTQCEKE